MLGFFRLTFILSSSFKCFWIRQDSFYAFSVTSTSQTHARHAFCQTPCPQSPTSQVPDTAAIQYLENGAASLAGRGWHPIKLLIWGNPPRIAVWGVESSPNCQSQWGWPWHPQQCHSQPEGCIGHKEKEAGTDLPEPSREMCVWQSLRHNYETRHVSTMDFW